jgi:hypothetical protein
MLKVCGGRKYPSLFAIKGLIFNSYWYNQKVSHHNPIGTASNRVSARELWMGWSLQDCCKLWIWFVGRITLPKFRVQFILKCEEGTSNT